ncbi:hypothetical protein B9T26_09235 [Acinetobacter sp. ANC 4169]|uniref:hypothetical protein n=1 Tax=Acinetobacter sp. ANC 4169 TaxID=1977879 RepID=UPI000A348D5E|nr:hypothetical protein [Acinetobacter sp. ANC 4169]OTG73259.1 hypothetical protein B9T26_09235 [Acinetobacter sp. ANC 4169]
MSNKQNINEITLSTAENIADELIFKSATTFVEDLAKSVPVASIALGLTKAISNYKTAKDQRQLLAFIQEAENTDAKFIEKFFKDKNNTELGFEILGILDQTYLEKQARMIFRTAKLFKEKEINKLEFDKYTYIITHLNSHLINILQELFFLKTNNEDPEFEFDISNPNMELVSFQFLREVESPLVFDGKTKIARYKRTDEFYQFYEKIFKD